MLLVIERVSECLSVVNLHLRNGDCSVNDGFDNCLGSMASFTSVACVYGALIQLSVEKREKRKQKRERERERDTK